MAVIFVRQLAIPFLRYQLPVCFLGVPRNIKTILWFRFWETQVWTEESGFDSLRRKFLSSHSPVWLLGPPNHSEVVLTSLRSSQPPVQCASGGHISRAQNSQDTKLTTHRPAVLRLRMHGALPPLSIHVIIWCLTNSRCQLTCNFTAKLRYLVDASDVCVGATCPPYMSQ
jgi:hypothetical protein